MEPPAASARSASNGRSGSLLRVSNAAAHADRGAPSPRRNQPARAVAAHLAAATALYSVPASAADEARERERELRAALEREKDRRRAAETAAEAAASDTRVREEQISTLSRHLVSAQAEAAAARAEASKRAAAEGSVASSTTMVAPSAALDAGLQARLRTLETEAARAKTFEAENAHLRSVAVTLQGQRDAFESVARQLQSHAVAAEAAFTSLQAEAGALLTSHKTHEEALATARATLQGYETGLTQLLTALGKQQEKIRKCVGR